MSPNSQKSIEEIFQTKSHALEPALAEKKSRKAKVISGIVLAVAIIIIAFIGFWKYDEVREDREKQKKNSILSAPIQEKIEISQPEEKLSEPEKEKVASAGVADKKPSEIKINVFNGGAPAGSAGKIKSLLEAKGYSQVEAENTASDYSGTIIYYTNEEFLLSAQTLRDELKGEYKDAKVSVAQTSEEKSSDLVIILGE